MLYGSCSERVGATGRTLPSLCWAPKPGRPKGAVPSFVQKEGPGNYGASRASLTWSEMIGWCQLCGVRGAGVCRCGTRVSDRGGRVHRVVKMLRRRRRVVVSGGDGRMCMHSSWRGGGACGLERMKRVGHVKSRYILLVCIER